MFGASRQAPEKLSNGHKPPNGQEKNPEKTGFQNRKKVGKAGKGRISGMALYEACVRDSDP
jgi:hypothetical protein